MDLKGKRHRRGGRAAALDGDAFVVRRALRRVQLVREVRNVAVLAAGAEHERKVRAGARQVVVGHHGPRDADLVQDGNHVFGEAGLRRKVAARVGGIGAPEDLHLAAMDAQFHFQRFVAHQRRQGVMIGEVDQVHARFAAAGGPGARLLVIGIPVARIAQLAVGAEALDVFHQRAGVIDLSAGVRIAEHAAERVVRPALVGGHAVVHAENAGDALRARDAGGRHSAAGSCPTRLRNGRCPSPGGPASRSAGAGATARWCGRLFRRSPPVGKAGRGRSSRQTGATRPDALATSPAERRA